MDQESMLDLQNRENRNRWYQVEKVSDREVLIRFPKDDLTSQKVLDGYFRFVLMEAGTFEAWRERAQTGLQVGLMLGLIFGILIGYVIDTIKQR